MRQRLPKFVFSDFERVCNLPFTCHFDNDTKSVIAAENNGRTILEGSNSDLSKQFKKFAATFVDRSGMGDDVQETGANKLRFANLIGKR